MAVLGAALLAALLAWAPAAHGQLRQSTAIEASASADSVAPPLARFTARVGAGSLGWVVGAAMGGVSAYHLLPGCTGCEDPGLTQALLGILVGGALGTGLTAPIPDFGDPCSYRSRLLGSLIGAGIGALGGVLLALESDNPLPVPIGPVVGAAAGSFRCRAVA